jgi:hypothetical protein
VLANVELGRIAVLLSSTYLIGSALRLTLAVGACLLLPGWIVSQAYRRRPTILGVSTVGLGLHIAALVLIGLVTPRIDRVVAVLVPATLALAVLVRVVATRRWPPDDQSDWGISLSRLSISGVAVLVGVAAVIRWFHNYHYDDLQHLTYLTELVRQNRTFPDQFTLTLPFGMQLARYPYWALSEIAITRLAGVPLGDGYYLLGLGLFGLALGVAAGAMERGWSARHATMALFTLILGSTFIDSLLNYGGYPFQCGKLLVLAAAAAIFAYWRSRDTGLLVYAVTCLFIAPLLHPNNAISAALILGALLMSGRVLRLSAARRAATCVVILLAAVTVGSVLTDGFIRRDMRPAADASKRRSMVGVAGWVEAPSISGSEVPGALERDPVSRRIALFVKRAIPIELIVTIAVIALVQTTARFGMESIAAQLVIGISVAGLIVSASASLARQIALTVVKPGYLPMRPKLVGLAPVIRGQVITDPITRVFGAAAGWAIDGPPQLDVPDERRPLMIFNPEVRGSALAALLAGIGDATLVINEEVLGVGTSDKFRDIAEARLVAETAAPTTDPASVLDAIATTVRNLQTLDYTGDGSHQLRIAAIGLWRTAFSRPVRVFAVGRQGSPPNPQIGVELRAIAQLPVENIPAGEFRAHPFLNSALVSVTLPRSCIAGLRIATTRTATFDDGIAIWAFDRNRAAMVPFSVTAPSYADTTTSVVAFNKPSCDSHSLVLFVHSFFWYDYRFRIASVAWLANGSPE